MRKKIQDKSWGYSVVKPFVSFALRLFYPRTQCLGRENIPKDKCVIFAPNHQNALIDALLILSAQKGSTVFLARADIFKKRVIARILSFLRILPVYRIRDGRDELDKNYEIFEKSVDVLRDGVPLCLMPEGRQSFKRQLLPLVKGMFRIAYQAQMEIPDREVVIVPVGIDYTSYTKPFAQVVVQFGQPIAVRPHLDIYTEQPGQALNLLREEVSAGIRPLIQDIQSKDHYYDFYAISRIEEKSRCKKHQWKSTPFNGLRARQETTKELEALNQSDPEEANRLCEEYRSKYPTRFTHEKKGDEFKSSVLFVVFLILFLLAILSLVLAWVF